MRIYLDDDSYVDIKKDVREDKARVTIKTLTKEKTHFIISALLDDEQIEKVVAELVSIRATL